VASTLEGRTALITGAAQGQGRSHAVRLAELGASLLLMDMCADIPEAGSPQGTLDALTETAALAEKAGAQVRTAQVDVRDAARLTHAIDSMAGEFGRLDVVVANAGIARLQRWDEVSQEIWDATIAVNLTGVWNTCRAAIPHVISTGGGSVIIINSAAGLKGLPFMTPYTVSKHGLVGLMRCLAIELGNQNVRVNCIHPTVVDTPMSAVGEQFPRLLAELPEAAAMFRNTLPVQSVQASDISDAVAFLAGDEARFITGVCLPVDAGTTIR
jgi:SDR family mycofactocin-dependent oxidoreductase